MNAIPYLDIGIYSVPQASRLTGIPAARIRRWIKGYHYWAPDTSRKHSPQLLNPELPVLNGQVALGFLDLLELRFVDAFLQYGVSLKAIRHAAERAIELFNDRHPFAMERFYTDGKRIFLGTGSGAEQGKALLDLKDDQFAIYDVLLPSLKDGLSFDKKSGRPLIWAPNRATPAVVLDPRREFGQPIIHRVGVPTAALAAAFKAERSVERVAQWYDVQPEEVEQAIRFELKAA